MISRMRTLTLMVVMGFCLFIQSGVRLFNTVKSPSNNDVDNSIQYSENEIVFLEVEDDKYNISYISKYQDNDEFSFPSTIKCDYQKYRKKLINEKKKHAVATQNLYPCKRTRQINNPDWPIVLKPSRGKLLKDIPLTHIQPEVMDLVKAGMREQEKRLDILARTCSSHPELQIPEYHTFVWATDRKIPVIYCPLYKIASTTWMANFLRLAHFNDDKDMRKNKMGKYMPAFGGGHEKMFELYKEPELIWEKINDFQSSIRFLNVRHPFSRILSAYRDKMERDNPKPYTPYFLDLQRAIIHRYRPANSPVTAHTPTFSEFVDYLIDFTANLTTSKEWIENTVCWTPYWAQCGVCSSDYHVVVKLETMQDDVQFLAHLADLKEIQNVNEWRNIKKKSSSDVSTKYFGQLTKNQIMMLYERFKLDFELFDYSVDEFLENDNVKTR